jgi:hypothetical protein
MKKINFNKSDDCIFLHMLRKGLSVLSIIFVFAALLSQKNLKSLSLFFTFSFLFLNVKKKQNKSRFEKLKSAATMKK